MVAHEAALLLYYGLEKEYLQAKRRATRSLNVKILPSNRDVAEELDSIAEELEGQERQRRLIRLRTDALGLMQSLRQFSPRLIGSVWRGTATRNSDIDIRVFSDDRGPVERAFVDSGYVIQRKVKRLKQDPISGRVNTYHHIYLKLSGGVEAEIVVHRCSDPEDAGVCAIYGDLITGLGVEGLSKVMMEDPLKKFVPNNR
jgi:hypothetical protein